MTGSVLPNLLAMTFEGEGVLRENAGLRDHALWFIAHEAAHFWLGDAVVYEYSRDSWITEGGADLLAFRIVAEVDPHYDWRGELQKAIDDCVRLSTGQGVASAEDRGEQRAYYACGVVFGLVAEAASRRPFGAFVRRLVDANRADRVLTRGEWLAGLDRVSHDPSLSADIARLLDQGAPDPAALIASLFTRAGMRYALAETAGRGCCEKRSRPAFCSERRAGRPGGGAIRAGGGGVGRDGARWTAEFRFAGRARPGCSPAPSRPGSGSEPWRARAGASRRPACASSATAIMTFWWPPTAARCRRGCGSSSRRRRWTSTPATIRL